MTQAERITHMEEILNEATDAVSLLSAALEQYSALQNRLQELFVYYTGDLWQQDFDDDNAGKLPDGLRRGVLSEDAVHDLLTEVSGLKDRMRDLSVQ